MSKAKAKAAPATTAPRKSPAKKAKAAEPQTETVLVTVTAFPSTSGVDLTVNGKSVHLPIGQPTRVHRRFLSALNDTDGLSYTIQE